MSFPWVYLILWLFYITWVARFLSKIFFPMGTKDSVEKGGGDGAVRPQAEMRRVSSSFCIGKNIPGSLFVRLFTFSLVCLFSIQNNKMSSLKKNYTYVLQNIVYSILVCIVHEATQVHTSTIALDMRYWQGLK